jgi:hypothetical protein
MGSGLKTNDLAASGWRAIGTRRAKKGRVPWPVLLFLIGLVVPWVITVGPLRLSIYRFVLLIAVLPCLGMWLSGKAGRIRLADITLMLFWFWCALSFVVIHGVTRSVEPAGIAFIETLGAFFLARCYIRNADDFENTIQLLFKIVVVLLPFSLFEFATGHNILRDLFAAILPVKSDPPMPGRLGFTRVQSVFDHPILYGVFSASILALVHLVLGYRKSLFQRFVRTGLVGAASLLSLSSGPLAAIVAQGFLLSWNGLLGTIKIRWKILIGVLILMILVVELVANRSVLTIVTSYVLFDPGSYWFRRLIWMYGSASALNHPLFGVGMNEWERPEWMGDSIDNFWLLYAVKHGLPAAFLLLLTLMAIVLPVCSRKGLDARLIEYRTGFLITMTALFLVGWTVHFWDAALALFVFLMGSGVWMLDAGSMQGGALEAKQARNAQFRTKGGCGFDGRRGHSLPHSNSN